MLTLLRGSGRARLALTAAAVALVVGIASLVGASGSQAAGGTLTVRGLNVDWISFDFQACRFPQCLRQALSEQPRRVMATQPQ